MTGCRGQKGFSLIAAIFLLVVVAGLVVFVTNIRSAQQITLVYGVQGARANQAARAGLEWGVHQAIRLDNCNAANTAVSANAATLSQFTINVRCVSSEHVEGGTTVEAYQITADAFVGSYGTLDYVSRSLQATVSIQPP